MICDKIENLRLYVSYCNHFNTIADFLEKNDLKTLRNGEYDIGSGISLNISEYEPYAAGDKWEAHEKYADLQIVVDGNEKMDAATISNAEGIGAYNDEHDFKFCDTCGDSFASVYAENDVFAYFEPRDAHRPGLRYRADKVKKAVFKIPVDK